MPVIPIPHDFNEEPEEIEVPVNTKPKEWYDWFLNVPSWKCSCGLTNFGRNKKCADQRCNLERPTDYETRLTKEANSFSE